MRNPEQQTISAGVDARSAAQLPRRYAQYHQANDPVTLAVAIRQLLRATAGKGAFDNPFVED